MRLYEIITKEAAGVGKIVKGVNTTPDVQPGEVQRQAAKWGFTLDNSGVPPTLNANGTFGFPGKKKKKKKK